MDVNGDGTIGGGDVLQVVNYVNSLVNASSQSQGSFASAMSAPSESAAVSSDDGSSVADTAFGVTIVSAATSSASVSTPAVAAAAADAIFAETISDAIDSSEQLVAVDSSSRASSSSKSDGLGDLDITAIRTTWLGIGRSNYAESKVTLRKRVWSAAQYVGSRTFLFG